MSERELALALERRAALPAHEALSLEGVQRCGGHVRVTSDRARPEHLADDGRVLEEAFLRVRETVEAGGDDALKCLRKRELVSRAPLGEELDELLCIQRVAARPLEQGLLRIGRKQWPGEQAPDELRRLLVGER